MKAQDAIKWLSNYDPEQEIIIAWWDKDTSGYELTDEQWLTIVEAVSDNDNVFDDVSYVIDEVADENNYKQKEIQ
jgi:hypothetical protein